MTIWVQCSGLSCLLSCLQQQSGLVLGRSESRTSIYSISQQNSSRFSQIVFLSLMHFFTLITLNKTFFCVLVLSSLESIHNITKCSTGLLVLRTMYFCFPRACCQLNLIPKLLYQKREGIAGPYLPLLSHHDFVNHHHISKFFLFQAENPQHLEILSFMT